MFRGLPSKTMPKQPQSLMNLTKIPAIELNISCPNVKQGGMAFGVSAKGASEVVKAVRSAYKKDTYRKTLPKRYGYHRK